jgi:hypothetical protein
VKKLFQAVLWTFSSGMNNCTMNFLPATALAASLGLKNYE